MTACQRWNPGRVQTWRRPEDGGFDRRRYKVRAIEESAEAMPFVLDRHYAGSYPNGRLQYGLFDVKAECGPRLVGVAVLSSPVNVRVLTNVFPHLEPYYESADLGRFVLDDSVPANGESFFLARVLRFASAAGVRGVVSFSDPLPRRDQNGNLVKPGHIGLIYQASNAMYTGRSTVSTLHVLPDGTVFNRRTQQKIRDQDQGHEYAEKILIRWGARPMRAGEKPNVWLAEALRAAGTRRVRHHGDHRYVFLTRSRDAGRVVISQSAMPYPKTPDEDPSGMAA